MKLDGLSLELLLEILNAPEIRLKIRSDRFHKLVLKHDNYISAGRKICNLDSNPFIAK